MTVGTLVTLMVLIVCVALIIRHMVRAHKNGSSCGCGGCNGCSCAAAGGQNCSCQMGQNKKL